MTGYPGKYKMRIGNYRIGITIGIGRMEELKEKLQGVGGGIAGGKGRETGTEMDGEYKVSLHYIPLH